MYLSKTFAPILSLLFLTTLTNALSLVFQNGTAVDYPYDFNSTAHELSAEDTLGNCPFFADSNVCPRTPEFSRSLPLNLLIGVCLKVEGDTVITSFSLSHLCKQYKNLGPLKVTFFGKKDCTTGKLVFQSSNSISVNEWPYDRCLDYRTQKAAHYHLIPSISSVRFDLL